MPRDPTLDKVADALDPVLAPLGFARGQLGSSESEASVIFCRGDEGSYDGTWVDFVIDLRPHPVWRITDVRYWGFPSERWHLAFPANGDLRAQLDVLRKRFPQNSRSAQSRRSVALLRVRLRRCLDAVFALSSCRVLGSETATPPVAG